MCVDVDGEIREWVGQADSKMVEYYRHLGRKDAVRRMEQISFVDLDADDDDRGKLELQPADNGRFKDGHRRPKRSGLSQCLGQTQDALRKSLSTSDLRRASKIKAERTGFEPAEGCNPLTDLANRRFRPLSHLSGLTSL